MSKIHRTEIELTLHPATASGKGSRTKRHVKVEAYGVEGVPHLLVHRSLKRNGADGELKLDKSREAVWQVTHEPTGYRVGPMANVQPDCATRAEAVAYARAISPLHDWSFTDGKHLLKMSKRERLELFEALKAATCRGGNVGVAYQKLIHEQAEADRVETNMRHDALMASVNRNREAYTGTGCNRPA